ncbi:MAG: sulfotransferase [Acidobacteria bacterium]|nr:sulfotransferase [Acidobacteriota bacterium]
MATTLLTSRAMLASVRAASPVFIVGVMNRCGTNYLSHVLRLHPVFKLPGRIVEDYLLEHSDLLVRYVEKTGRSWGQSTSVERRVFREQLLSRIGDGILAFLGDQIDEGRRVLAKTPSARHLENFFRLFPHAQLVILVRDGRDVVESAGRSWRYAPGAYWMERWASGARAILRFMDETGGQDRGWSWTLVKYEDLIRDPERVVRELLAFLDVDESAFNWSGLQSIPLRGSSVHRGSRDRVHWDVVEKPDEFQPIGRWQHWHWAKRRIFKVVAGRELIRFGYVVNSRW